MLWLWHPNIRFHFNSLYFTQVDTTITQLESIVLEVSALLDSTTDTYPHYLLVLGLSLHLSGPKINEDTIFLL